jgi:hypothetical protein
MSKTLAPTDLPTVTIFELGEVWQGRGIRASVTFQNSYDETPRTIQGRAYYNPEGRYVAVKLNGSHTLIPLSILKGIEKQPRTYHSDALGAVTIPED